MIDFYQIQADLSAVLAAADYSGVIHPNGSTIDVNHFIEGMQRDLRIDRMPFTNTRLTEGEAEIRALPNGYYITLNFSVDIVAFDFTEFKIAANIRDDLLQVAMNAIRENRQFSATLNSSAINPRLDFGAGVPEEGQSGHIAFVTFNVMTEAYVDAN